MILLHRQRRQAGDALGRLLAGGAVCLLGCLLGASAGLPAAACDNPNIAIGVAREIKIDTTSGPIYGGITRYAREPHFLAEKEVVLTFDDGPSPRITRSILKTLKQFCTKATFFPVGRMAITYPKVIREIAIEGHTIGAHTWSHPNNLRRLKTVAASEQVEKGFAAVAMAAGGDVAPFFRFPGLNDDKATLTHLQQRGIATISVDIVTDDSFSSDPAKLVRQTIARTVHAGGGILLFHDIKMTTALALPAILAELKSRGFKVVHLTAKHGVTPVTDYDEALKKRFMAATRSDPLPDTALRAPVHPVGAFAVARPPVTVLAPSAKAIERAGTRRKPINDLRGPADTGGWTILVAPQKQ
jgi:peptidoglycan-N-acetylglucosamine deacetylase